MANEVGGNEASAPSDENVSHVRVGLELRGSRKDWLKGCKMISLEVVEVMLTAFFQSMPTIFSFMILISATRTLSVCVFYALETSLAFGPDVLG